MSAVAKIANVQVQKQQHEEFELILSTGAHITCDHEPTPVTISWLENEYKKVYKQPFSSIVPYEDNPYITDQYYLVNPDLILQVRSKTTGEHVRRSYFLYSKQKYDKRFSQSDDLAIVPTSKGCVINWKGKNILCNHNPSEDELTWIKTKMLRLLGTKPETEVVPGDASLTEEIYPITSWISLSVRHYKRSAKYPRPKTSYRLVFEDVSTKATVKAVVKKKPNPAATQKWTPFAALEGMEVKSSLPEKVVNSVLKFAGSDNQYLVDLVLPDFTTQEVVVNINDPIFMIEIFNDGNKQKPSIIDDNGYQIFLLSSGLKEVVNKKYWLQVKEEFILEVLKLSV